VISGVVIQQRMGDRTTTPEITEGQKGSSRRRFSGLDNGVHHSHSFAVRGVDRKRERDLPPQLYDLTELQRDMNRRRGRSADSTLKAAQALYEAKFITYPRTDSRYLTGDMKGQLPGILGELRSAYPEAIGRLDPGALAFTGRIVDDAKVRDHHAIIPPGSGRAIFRRPSGPSTTPSSSASSPPSIPRASRR
jgi:DNA topoisomerase IA